MFGIGSLSGLWSRPVVTYVSFLTVSLCVLCAIGRSGNFGRIMAEDGIPADINETMSSCTDVQLTPNDVLLLSADELRTELRVRGKAWSGLSKPDMQMLLLRALGGVTGEGSGDGITEEKIVTERSPIASPRLAATVQPPPAPVVIDYPLPPPARSRSPSGEGESVRALELKLQLRRLELEDREKERQFELRKLQLQVAPRTLLAGSDAASQFRVEAAVRLIPKFDENDIETFLISFEKIARLNSFPADKYTAVLQAHLTGKALKVFTELSTAECQDYPTLKKALLAAYAVVPEVYRKRFRSLNKSHSETYSEFAFRLSTLFKRWAESEKAYDNINKLRELILMEQFNSHLEASMRGWLIDQKPKTLAELSRLADQYIAVHRAERTNRPDTGFKSQQYRHKFGQGNSPTQKVNPSSHSATDRDEGGSKQPTPPNKSRTYGTGYSKPPVTCYFCKKPGHVMAVCRKRMAQMSAGGNEEKPVQLVALPPGGNAPVTTAEEVIDSRYKNHCVDAHLISPDGSKRSVNILRDTGALQSLVSSSVVSNDEIIFTGEQRLIRGVTGDVMAVPLVEVSLDSVLCSGTFLCGLVSTLPAGIALLVGNDLSNHNTISDINVVTRSMTAAMRTEDKTSQKTVDEVKPQQNNTANFPGFTSDEFPLAEIFPENAPQVQTLTRDQLIDLQQRDASLQSLFALASETDSDYVLQSGVLVRVYRDLISPPAAAIHQVVVPTVLRAKLLEIAHSIPAAGHLGVAKTKARLQRHFYWPTISSDIKEFCKTCDVCQRLGKGGPPAIAPLHSLPLVSEPFCQVAIDIIGPLPPCKDTGHRFILTVLDLCTHYPEAVPLTRHTARDVAKALSTVFSRFGFAQEILSDQGADFMSELMQIFLSEFGISQIRTSAYHPQTNGACERFNGTLKTMLMSLTEKFPDSWDEALPWVLFAYREVPVETLGCSPFDLLFGRCVAGPLALLKSAWLHETDLSSAKQNVVEFILNTREHLRHAVEAASEHAAQQRSQAKTWYDKRAVTRTFTPGEKVLVLLPVPGKPLQAKYHGPYTVSEQLGPVDYVIETPDRRKTKRVCHINLLKKYHERDARLAPPTENSAAEFVGVTDPIESEVSPPSESPLTTPQQNDLTDLISEFSDIFSEQPGKTHLLQHHIKLTPGATPSRSAPYRLSPDKMDFVKKEIATLKEQGIVEDAPSDSTWAAPIVVVKKADGGWRLCTDFRKLNTVTEPDPFPLPRIDDLLDKVGKARYMTKVDMAKSYYQVRCHDDCVPMTGFVTPFGFFRWKYMPFGLRNAPATFSRLVCKLILGCESFCAVYIDDLLIFSDSWSNHMKHLRIVFERVRNAGLTLKRSKCEFAVAELDYLGHHIGLGKVTPREQKVRALLEFPRPTNRKCVQRFLGLAGYFRRFLPHYSESTCALTDLLKKNAKFVWNDACEQAFLDIKSRLASRPILRPPDYDQPFLMAVDASDKAIGAYLFQCVDGIEHPICFLSKKLNKHQRNYSTVEKEAFGLLFATRAFSVYFGTSPVVVYTDHSPLQFLQRMSNYNQKLLRWNLELQEYNLTVKHRPGRENILPDLLSRPS